MSGNKLKNKVSSLAIILMLVCSGIVIILPSVVAFPGVSMINEWSESSEAELNRGPNKNIEILDASAPTKLRTLDCILDWESYNPGAIYMIGGFDPATHIIKPANNSILNTVGVINGNITYNNQTHSITKVEISIKRMGDSKYWNSSGWNNTQNWLLAGKNVNTWNYNGYPVTWTSGNKYLLQSRATDNKSKVETPSYGNVITFDTTKPISNINYPINNSVVASLNNISGNASDSGGAGVKYVHITLENTNANLYWTGFNWSMKTWLKASGTTNWVYSTASITFSTGIKYRIQSKATDNANNEETPSWGTVFYIGTQPFNVSSSINVPANNSYINSLNTISGFATPASNTSVTKVEVSIKRFSTALYWNGTGWNAALSWLLATGTTSWNYNSAAVNWSSSIKYHIRSRAHDNKTNVETPKYGNIFTFDDIKPSSNITYPVNNSLLKSITNITGTAGDTGGSGLNYVRISIKQNSTGKYYDGWGWGSQQKWLIVTGATSWIYNIITNNTWPPGTYHVQSRAVDKANNVENPSFGIIFTIQAGPNNLLSNIIIPMNNSWGNALNTISGNAYATGGLSVNKVEISIKETSTNKYWSGSGWTSTPTWLLASGKASWSYNSASVTWTSVNKYLIRSRVTHNASLVEIPTFGNYFSYETIKPSSTITSPGNNTSVINSSATIFSIKGTATDTGGSGVHRVYICIKQNSTGKYWNGGTWQTQQRWLPVSGTTNWAYNVWSNQSHWPLGKYYIQSKAKDRAGNVETPSYGNIFNLVANKSKPSSSIKSPGNNSFKNSVNNISGSANTNSRSVGIKQVEISIKQTSNDYYWDGAQWKMGEEWLLATGTESWTYDTSGVLWYTDAYYNIRSRAMDFENYVELPKPGVTYMFDNVAPQNLEIVINDDEKFTNSPVVTLSLYAQDSGSGIDEMAFSMDDIQWSTWEVFTADKPFELSAGDDEKMVYFKAKDRAGNIGTNNDDIYLDTTPPKILASVINNDENIVYVNDRLITLIIEVQEVASNVILTAFGDDGIHWSEWEEIELTSTRADGFFVTNEYLLPPGDGSKMVYCRIQDSAGNMVEHSTNRIFLDTMPPDELSVQINEGAKFTNSQDVILNLNAIDQLSGVSEMAFSFDGDIWTAWEMFDTTKPIILPSGDGAKALYMSVRDKAGNFEQTTDSIILDATSPHSLSILINNGATETESESVTLKLYGIDDTSGVYQMSFSSDGNTWSPWEDFSVAKSYDLPAGDGGKTIYFRVIDKAGNIAEPVNAKIQLNTELIIDTDADGYPDTEDAFPTDPAAAVDSDSDNSPDYWNPGKSEADSITGLHLDAFPTDPAASIDTDKDGYPDEWNPGMSEKDSVLNLQLDADPDDPNKYLKSEDTQNSYLEILMMVIIVIVFVVVLRFAMVYRSKRKRLGKPTNEDKIFQEITDEILQGKLPDESMLSEIELSRRLEEKYERGEISENTYDYIKYYK